MQISLTSEILRNLPEITAMTEFRFMKLPVIAAMTEVTETTETVIANLKIETEEDWLNFSLSEAMRVIMNLNYW